MVKKSAIAVSILPLVTKVIIDPATLLTFAVKVAAVMASIPTLLVKTAIDTANITTFTVSVAVFTVKRRIAITSLRKTMRNDREFSPNFCANHSSDFRITKAKLALLTHRLGSN
ncbi:MAG: hypothetical protein C4288_07260 [Leptolyngbya sp. ERB_1_1]